MALSDVERTEARLLIARALDEDLRYGSDITTSATVPADAVSVAALVRVRPG